MALTERKEHDREGGKPSLLGEPRPFTGDSAIGYQGLRVNVQIDRIPGNEFLITSSVGPTSVMAG